LGNGEL
jgi:hypothetical protein